MPFEPDNEDTKLLTDLGITPDEGAKPAAAQPAEEHHDEGVAADNVEAPLTSEPPDVELRILRAELATAAYRQKHGNGPINPEQFTVFENIVDLVVARINAEGRGTVHITLE